MRDVDLATQECRFFAVRRARRRGRTAALFFLMTLLSVNGQIQAQEARPAPSDRDALIAAADRARAEARFGEAVRLYSRVEKDFGADARVARGRAMAREMLSEDRKAIEDYKVALRSDPTDYESLEHLAGIYERGGIHIPDAIRLYKKALDLDPRPESKDNLAVWIAMLESRLRPGEATAVGCWSLANDKALKGDLAGAESLYTRAIELNPQMFQAYYSRGLIHVRAADPTAALADFEQTLRIAPQFAQAFLQRGLVQEQLGNAAAAREDFDRVVTLDPRDPLALYHFARTLEAGNDPETALKLYRDALRFRPSRELSAAIQEKISALPAALRAKRPRNQEDSPETKALW